jgi:hypothetical protein
VSNSINLEAYKHGATFIITAELEDRLNNVLNYTSETILDDRTNAYWLSHGINILRNNYPPFLGALANSACASVMVHKYHYDIFYKAALSGEMNFEEGSISALSNANIYLIYDMVKKLVIVDDIWHPFPQSSSDNIKPRAVHRIITYYEKVISNWIKDNYLLELSSGSKPVVSICAPSKSIPTWKEYNDSFVNSILIPGIEKSITPEEQKKFKIRLYIAVDSDDPFYCDSTLNITNSPPWLDSKIISYESPHKGVIPFNSMMRDAYKDGASYFVRVNDDINFYTPGWLSLGVEQLASFDPPNVGVVGPSFFEGNVNLLTQDMTHRHHMNIFDGDYYPQVFDNFWIDDWISRVYGEKRTFKLPNWEIVHYVSPPRYWGTVDFTKQDLLEGEILIGRNKISRWLQERKK